LIIEAPTFELSLYNAFNKKPFSCQVFVIEDDSIISNSLCNITYLKQILK
jgi:hypothetical protein